MPSTINGLIVFLVALIPGVPGEAFYTQVTELNWREEQLRRIIRIVVISIAGLVTYVFLDDFLNWMSWGDLADPIYVMPSVLGENLVRSDFTTIAWAYAGHVASSSILGAAVGWGWLAISMKIGDTPWPSAWDDLINTHSKDHWVVVTLQDDTIYAGKIETADTGVPPDERDLLLIEPARYDEEEDVYVTMMHQHLFLNSSLIRSVGIIHDRDDEEQVEARVTEVGEKLFP